MDGRDKSLKNSLQATLPIGRDRSSPFLCAQVPLRSASLSVKRLKKQAAV
jgi:hypothetical protein